MTVVIIKCSIVALLTTTLLTSLLSYHYCQLCSLFSIFSLYALLTSVILVVDNDGVLYVVF